MDSNLSSIPEEFYSFESEQPFEKCLICKADLLSGDVDYFIEKAIRNYHEHNVSDVVYEYAICWQCAHDMNGQMSAESMQNLQEYFSGQELFLKNLEEYNRNWPSQEGSPIPSKCIITGQAKSQLDEYMIYGHFRGDKMVKSSMPYLLSGKVMDEVSDLLSNQTIDQLDDFMGEYFGGPPELEELWKPRRPVFF
jgi:hypothetical protein